MQKTFVVLNNILLENTSILHSIMRTIESKSRKNIFEELYDQSSDEDELDIYLKEPPIKMGYNFNVLKYWLARKESPLQRMAIDILCIPASSTDFERLFSFAKLDDTKLRQSLEPKFKGELQIAKSSFKMEEIIKTYCFGY